MLVWFLEHALQSLQSILKSDHVAHGDAEFALATPVAARYHGCLCLVGVDLAAKKAKTRKVKLSGQLQSSRPKFADASTEGRTKAPRKNSNDED